MPVNLNQPIAVRPIFDDATLLPSQGQYAGWSRFAARMAATEKILDRPVVAGCRLILTQTCRRHNDLSRNLKANMQAKRSASANWLRRQIRPDSGTSIGRA